MVNMIEIKESFDLLQWDEFVNKHPCGNIYQYSKISEVYSNTKNFEPLSLVAIDSNTLEILALLQGVVMKQMSGFLGSLTSRIVISGGPLYEKSEKGFEALDLLMQQYNKIAKNKAIYTQIRNVWDTTDVFDIYKKNEFSFIDHFSATIDLDATIDELWANIKRDKKRGIKKAEKMGLKVEVCEKKSDIDIFYKLLNSTYSEAKVPLSDKSLFEATYDILVPENNAMFLFVKDANNNIIATQLALMDNDCIYAWYTGAIRDKLKFHPGDLLIWHLLKYGVENKYKRFDFGGGGSQNKNKHLREYKSRFGTKFGNYGRYEKIHSPLKYKLAQAGLKIWEVFS